ncbi:MAG: HAMP domain-containing histidine kinase [Prevotella sp.]|nr:HAMP domain-containing histidine kinase [Prevotella sp.]
MKQRKLINLLLSRFSISLVILLILSAPLFYFIVIRYYSEDLREVAQMANIPLSRLDLEKDAIIGLVLQILSMVFVLGASIFLVMRLVPVKLWRPFYDTLDKISHFKVEGGRVPVFADSEVMEFNQLNDTLSHILTQNVRSYQVQKQFTENASHELQTPLAIVQGKLDLLSQTANLTEEQVELIEDVYHEIGRMSRLNRNLLLLAKIENAQYQLTDHINLADKLHALLPSLELLADGLHIDCHIEDKSLTVNCNEVLLESMIHNLIVNAVRHNRTGGTITITLDGGRLVVGNTSDEPVLDTRYIFERFHRSMSSQKGNGLGLAIVKSICDYHRWSIAYDYHDNWHEFCVNLVS